MQCLVKVKVDVLGSLSTDHLPRISLFPGTRQLHVLYNTTVACFASLLDVQQCPVPTTLQNRPAESSVDSRRSRLQSRSMRSRRSHCSISSRRLKLQQTARPTTNQMQPTTTELVSFVKISPH